MEMDGHDTPGDELDSAEVCGATNHLDEVIAHFIRHEEDFMRDATHEMMVCVVVADSAI